MFIKNLLRMHLCACLLMPFVMMEALADDSIEYLNNYRLAPLTINDSGQYYAGESIKVFIEDIWLESPEVQRAQAQLDASSERVLAANRPLHNPVLAFDIENSVANTRSIGVNQTIDLSGKRSALVNIANQNSLSAELTLYDVKQDIAVEALLALAGYFNAKEMHSVALQRSKLMLDFLDTVKQRYASGDIDSLDLTFSQVAYSEALITQATTASQLAEREAVLLAVSGLVENRWPQLPQELVGPPDTAELSLLNSLPKLTLLQTRMETAQARINLAQRDTRADPTFGIRAGSEDSEVLLGLSIEVPLFVRNNYKSLIRAASYDALSEEQAYRSAYRRAKAHLVGSLGRFEHTSQAWNIWLIQGQKAHQEQMSLLGQIWQAGELNATDFLIQAKQNIDTLAAATQLKGEVWQSLITWLQSSGQIGSWLGLSSSVPGVITKTTTVNGVIK